jgi:hypothetical protein
MAKESNNYGTYRIQYTKENGEKSEREIIKFGEPRDTLLALQVDTLAPEKKKELTDFLRKQKEELNLMLKTLGVEFKSFKPAGVEYLDTSNAA